MNTSLKKYVEAGNNIYDIIGKSRNEIPEDKKKIYSILAKYILNPTKIHFVSMPLVHTAIRKIAELKGKKCKPFFTSCIFCLSGKNCGNHRRKRSFEVTFTYNLIDIKVIICYPDISKCRNRITFGFHLDFDFTYDGRSLRITGGRTFISTPRESIPKKPEKPKAPQINIENFPTLGNKPVETNTAITCEKKISNATNFSKIVVVSQPDDKTIEEEKTRLKKILEDLKKEHVYKVHRVEQLNFSLENLQSKRPTFDDKGYFDDNTDVSFSIR